MEKMMSKKLDYLMKLTNTQNAALGRALRFDASYISRIRNGKRGLPSEQSFIWPAAVFFAERITENYQKEALVKELHLNQPYPESRGVAAHLIASWMKSGTGEPSPLSRIIANMSVPAVLPDVSDSGTGALPSEAAKAEVSLYYGNAGKREGVLAFLRELIDAGEPLTLLLNSDEDMAWLYEEPGFVRQWERMMIRLIRNGCRIKIIHTINRDANEMWEAVQKWLPLYKTGSIEPFYYPRLRDGVRRHTLFVAAGRSSFFSGSVRGQQGDALNQLIRDRTAVRALEQEFQAFLSLCCALMELVYPERLADAAPAVRAFLDSPGEPLIEFSEDMAICVKESTGAFILKTDAPCVIFTLKEPRMVSAVTEYLENHPGTKGDAPLRALERLKNIAAGKY